MFLETFLFDSLYIEDQIVFLECVDCDMIFESGKNVQSGQQNNQSCR